MSLGTFRTLTVGVSLALAATCIVTLVLAAGSRDFALDFREAYLPAAESLVEVGSPYEVNEGSPDAISGMYLYPPQLAFALSPLTQIPTDVAAFMAFLGALAALLGALALLGVRDVRCYAILVVWAPGWQTLQMANVSALLVLGLALVWRYRDNMWKSGAALGIAVSLKLFLWPMLVWALTTRQRMAGRAMAIGLGVTLASWAAIGFAGFTAYPGVLRAVPQQPSFSIVAVAERLGYAHSVGYVLMVVVGAPLLAFAVKLGRRGDDVRAYTLALAAALALTPILWWHYLTLLVVPLSLARPRFSPLWLLPIAVWLARSGSEGAWAAVPLLVAAGVTAAILIRPDAARPALLPLRPGRRPERLPAA